MGGPGAIESRVRRARSLASRSSRSSTFLIARLISIATPPTAPPARELSWPWYLVGGERRRRRPRRARALDVDAVVFRACASSLSLSLSLSLSHFDFPQKGKPLVAVETLWTGDRV
jgi:hypothetical protein